MKNEYPIPNIEAPCSKLQGIFDCKEFYNFWIRSLTPQPRQDGISAVLRQAAGNALAVAVQRLFLFLFSRFDTRNKNLN